MVIMMIDVCERLLLNVRNQLKQSKRTNHEIKAMLDDLFESNSKEFNKLKRIYGKTNYRIGTDIFGKMQFEHYEIEKLKKRMYGDSYEIKSFEYE